MCLYIMFRFAGNVCEAKKIYIMIKYWGRSLGRLVIERKNRKFFFTTSRSYACSKRGKKKKRSYVVATINMTKKKDKFSSCIEGVYGQIVRKERS